MFMSVMLDVTTPRLKFSEHVGFIVKMFYIPKVKLIDMAASGVPVAGAARTTCPGQSLHFILQYLVFVDFHF
jgi:hypothetical protein